MKGLILRTLREEPISKSIEFISYQAKHLTAEINQLQDSLGDLITKVEDDLDRGSLPHNLASIDQSIMEVSLSLMQVNAYVDYINSTWAELIKRVADASAMEGGDTSGPEGK